jgi:hypothetical protein
VDALPQWPTVCFPIFQTLMLSATKCLLNTFMRYIGHEGQAEHDIGLKDLKDFFYCFLKSVKAVMIIPRFF